MLLEYFLQTNLQLPLDIVRVPQLSNTKVVTGWIEHLNIFTIYW